MVEFKCPCCGTLLRAAEGDRVICVCCGAECYADGAIQQGTQLMQSPDMPRFGEPVPQPYAGQAYAQQYPGQGKKTEGMQQPVQAYSPEELHAARKKRSAWHLMNTAFLLIQSIVLALGVLWDDMSYEIGGAMIAAWLISIPVFAIASIASRPNSAYLERKPLHPALHFLLQLVLGGCTLFTGAIIWVILSRLF